MDGLLSLIDACMDGLLSLIDTCMDGLLSLIDTCLIVYSSFLTDGASAILIMSEEKALQLGTYCTYGTIVSSY